MISASGPPPPPPPPSPPRPAHHDSFHQRTELNWYLPIKHHTNHGGITYSKRSSVTSRYFFLNAEFDWLITDRVSQWMFTFQCCRYVVDCEYVYYFCHYSRCLRILAILWQQTYVTHFVVDSFCCGNVFIATSRKLYACVCVCCAVFLHVHDYDLWHCNDDVSNNR